jgi:hypothetical protein
MDGKKYGNQRDDYARQIEDFFALRFALRFASGVPSESPARCSDVI